jgi:hypothetical protein
MGLNHDLAWSESEHCVVKMFGFPTCSDDETDSA